MLCAQEAKLADLPAKKAAYKKASAEVPLDYQRYPEFPGGEDAMQTFLQSNLPYPELARENGAEGTVVLRLHITEYGSIETAEVVQSVGFGCDRAALAVVDLMPKWTPAQQGPYAIETNYYLPIAFRLR